MTQNTDHFFERKFSSVQFTQIIIKKYGRRYGATFFTKMAGVKAEVTISGDSVENVIYKTERFLDVKLIPDEICLPEMK